MLCDALELAILLALEGRQPRCRAFPIFAASHSRFQIKHQQGSTIKSALHIPNAPPRILFTLAEVSIIATRPLGGSGARITVFDRNLKKWKQWHETDSYPRMIKSELDLLGDGSILMPYIRGDIDYQSRTRGPFPRS
jgi:hypothetical protein